MITDMDTFDCLSLSVFDEFECASLADMVAEVEAAELAHSCDSEQNDPPVNEDTKAGYGQYCTIA